MAVLGAACALAIAGCSDEPELSAVVEAPPHLLDDGAGQRHFEVSYPEGRPRATMLLIHGAGWRSHGLSTFAQAQPTVDELTRAGFRVVAISTDESPELENTSRGAEGTRKALDDVLAFHDQVVDAFPDEPLCAHGVSGGGHLALMLAVERDDLRCVSALGPPTDLVALVRDGELGAQPRRTCAGSDVTPDIGFKIGACLAIQAWGESRSKLRRVSPARRWPDSLETRVWAGFEQADPVNPPSQQRALENAVDELTIETLRPDPQGPRYAHGGVRVDDLERAERSWMSWLDEVVPPAPGSPSLPDGDLRDARHTACNSRLSGGPSWAKARRGDRSDLLAASGRWRPQSESAALIAANSCDGRESTQEAGLALWAPGFDADGGEPVEQGTTAAWTFEAPDGSVASAISASFRGFIANPGFWRIGLYTRESGSEWSPVFECDGGQCDEVSLEPEAGGVGIVPPGQRPRRSSGRLLPIHAFELDGEPTEVKWELECVAARGCLPRSINPKGSPDTKQPRRPIDPTGRPAVLSIYELTVETAER